MLKMAELSLFLADFDPLQKLLLALKCEPIDQTKPNFQFSEHKKFPINGEKDNPMQHHLGCKKWQKHGASFT